MELLERSLEGEGAYPKRHVRLAIPNYAADSRIGSTVSCPDSKCTLASVALQHSARSLACAGVDLHTAGGGNARASRAGVDVHAGGAHLHSAGADLDTHARQV